MSDLDARVRRWVAIVLTVASLGKAGTALGQEGWLEPTCDRRMQLMVRGDMYARKTCTPAIVLNFNDILGAERTLAASSLRLRDARTRRPVRLDVAEDPDIRYASGNPALRLRWDGDALAAFAEKEWVLYFRTVEPGAPNAWRSLPETFRSTVPASVLLKTSFEAPNLERPDEPLDLRAWGEDKEGIHTERIWTDETARTGKRSLKISRTTDPDAVSWSNKPFWRMWPPSIDVQEGGIYRASVWIKTTRLKSRSWHANVSLRYLDAERRRPKGKSFLSMRGPQHACDWTHVSGTLPAPPGARYMCMNLSLAGDGEVFFDDLTVTRLPGSEVPPVEVSLGRLEDRDETGAGDETAGAEERKLLKVGLAQRPPKLDGVPDDPCWADAGRITDFRRHRMDTQPAPDQTTTVRACADGDALYLAFECVEPKGFEVVAEGAGRDGNIWKDDAVEIFLDTNLDRRSFYQVAFNAKGALFDQDTGVPGLPGESWNGPIDVAAKVLEDRWTAEVRIGFVGLRLAEAAGHTWTANFCRTSMRGGNRHLYTWVKVKRNFGEPTSFGQLILPLDPTANAVTARPLLEDHVSYGQDDLPVLVKNQRAKPVSVRLTVSDVGKETPRVAGQATLHIPAHAQMKATVPCSFPEVEAARLRVELHELPSAKLLYVTSGEYAVLNPLDFDVTSSLLYLNEPVVGGIWKVGIAKKAFRTSKLRLSVLSAGKPTTVGVQIVPTRSEGPFVLDVSRLTPGQYTLRGEFYLGSRKLAEKKLTISRISGPFGTKE